MQSHDGNDDNDDDDTWNNTRKKIRFVVFNNSLSRDEN